MKIASHHIPGTIRHQITNIIGRTPNYTPVCSWPEEATVQWGHGLIPAVPFFEAFLPNTFIRGEGESIEEAERKAFSQYLREKNCSHQWGRQRKNGVLYTNGAGWCKKCGAFRSKMFKPIVELGSYRRPLSATENSLIEDFGDDLSPSPYKRVLLLRKRLYGVAAPTK